jgi:hypothetical protein
MQTAACHGHPTRARSYRSHRLPQKPGTGTADLPSHRAPLRWRSTCSQTCTGIDNDAPAGVIATQSQERGKTGNSEHSYSFRDKAYIVYPGMRCINNVKTGMTYGESANRSSTVNPPLYSGARIPPVDSTSHIAGLFWHYDRRCECKVSLPGFDFGTQREGLGGRGALSPVGRRARWGRRWP